MSYQGTIRLVGDLNAYCQVKETSMKRLKATYDGIPTIWLSGKGKTIEGFR